MKRFLACWLIAGCARTFVFARPQDLGGAAPELRTEGAATVTVHERFVAEPATARVRLDDMVDAIVDQQVRHLSIADLLADCPPGTIRIDDETKLAYPNCRLLRAGNDITVGRPLRADNPSIIAVSVLGAIVGLGVCAFECRSPYSYASGAVLVSVTGLAAGFGVFLWALAHYD